MGCRAPNPSEELGEPEIHKMTTDPFEDFANENMTGYNRSRLRAEETRAERERRKKEAERNFLFAEWKAWHEKRKNELLAGVWSEAAQELSNFLENMGTEDAPALIALVERGPWRRTDQDTRFLVLELISHSIMYLRESHGLAPFDDALPFCNDDLNTFLIIREMLRDEAH
jgi:hypothetical protein